MTDVSALEAYAGQISEAAIKSQAAAQLQHEYIHGGKTVDVATESGPLPTLAKQAVQTQEKVTSALIDVASQMAGAMTYTSIAKGLLGTVNGSYFSVLSESSSEYSILYENVSGAAVERKRYPSKEALDKVAEKLMSLPQTTSGYVPIVSNERGQVVVWLENGELNGAGLHATITKAAQSLVKSGSFNPQMLPLSATSSGQVVSWLKSGRFNAAGLDLTIAEAVQAALASYQAPTTKFTDSSKLWLYRAQIANAMNGAGVARVFYTGDSWSHLVREISQPLADVMYSAYGQSGTGWISVYADEGGPTAVGAQLLNGAKLIKSAEWTVIDMSPTESDSLDGHAASATGTTGRIDITALKTQALTWYYKDTAGTFRYSIDGGTPVVVTGGNTGLRKSIQITGLTDVNHNIVFDLVGNTGTVVMYGGMATRTAPGVELSKSGNGGSTTVQWAAIAPFVQAYAAELKPNLVIIVLGTNDFNQGITKATYKSSLQTLVNAYQAGSPNCGVLLMTPVRAQSSLELGLIAQYAEAMSEISLATPGVEFLNLNAFMPPRITSDAYGMWKDALHLSVAGGRFVTALLMKYFLRVN